MTHDKKLKDPIYGYISIPVEYIKNIIDTAPFQRLRRIIQTSYAPLYSSAVHNRFVHSMGVFYLGEIVRIQLEKEREISQVLKKKIQKKDMKNLGRIFSLACLLHDVGHAPFSHTGEGFYLHEVTNETKKKDKKNEQYSNIHSLLIKELDSRSFSSDLKRITSFAAPHEIVSAYVGLKEYGELIGKDKKDREFFARCITGYLYSDSSKSLENCFISMLNSNVIDVDKLDYLVRDAYITGFDTVRIDFTRLLNSVTLYYDQENDKFQIAYYKSAISVIENVIYAHDAERKWIQTHPVVLYDGYLINHMIRELNELFDKKLFSVDAISKNGEEYKYDNNEKTVRIRLLCDDDIIALSKSLLNDPLIDEYFERNQRRHPLWKSEAEYIACIEEKYKGSKLEEVKSAIDIMLDSLEGKKVYSIDETYIKNIRNEMKKLDSVKDNLDKATYEAQMKGKLEILKICDGLNDYAKDNNITPDFVFLKASQFSSGFGKPDFEKISIVFNNDGKQSLKRFKEVVTTFDASYDKKDYYFIYSKNVEKSPINNKSVYDYLMKAFL